MNTQQACTTLLKTLNFGRAWLKRRCHVRAAQLSGEWLIDARCSDCHPQLGDDKPAMQRLPTSRIRFSKSANAGVSDDG